MKKLKRILAICLMVFYVCVLSACGKNNSVTDVIEDVGDGVKDITDDVTGTGNGARTR